MLNFSSLVEVPKYLGCYGSFETSGLMLGMSGIVKTLDRNAPKHLFLARKLLTLYSRGMFKNLQYARNASKHLAGLARLC